MKKVLSIILSAAMMSSFVLSAAAYDTSLQVINEKCMSFASQYDYKEGDFEKSFAHSPDVWYSSGIEYRADGSEYECPARYIDSHAIYFNSHHLQSNAAKLIVKSGGNEFVYDGVLYNSRLLIPINAFENAGCTVNFNPDTYVAQVSKNGTTLEILPNLIGMRKNKNDGFYVPLEVCARFIGDTLYVPVRAAAEELSISVGWNDEAKSAVLSE